MKKILFFPYHPDLWIVITHMSLLKEYEIFGFASFKEDDSLILAMNREAGIEGKPYEQLIQGCDAVVIVDNYRGFRDDKYHSIIDDASKLRKEILVTPLACLQLDLGEYQGRYRLIEHLPDGAEAIYCEYDAVRRLATNRRYEINVPVIGVVAQGKHCGKFETQLMLLESVGHKYCVPFVSSNALGALFGAYTVPSFLFDTISFEEKIMMFNYFVHKVSQECDPDLIVLGIPEGVTSFERQEFNSYSEHALVITAAVDIDFAILCMYFMREPIIEAGIRRFIEYCENRYRVPIKAVAISKTAVEVPGEYFEDIIFEYLDEPTLSKHYPDIGRIGVPVISLVNREKSGAAINELLQMLRDNTGTL